MKKIEYKKEVNGEQRVGIIMLPETIHEALKTMGEEKVYQHFRYAYLNAQRTSIKNKRTAKEKKHLRIELKKLSRSQKELLEKAGIL